MVEKTTYTKDELLEIMNRHLKKQQEIAEKLLLKAESVLDCDEVDNDTKKKRNHYINAYNTQVDAVSRTSASMLRIYNSSLESEEDEQEEKQSDSLID